MVLTKEYRICMPLTTEEVAFSYLHTLFSYLIMYPDNKTIYLSENYYYIDALIY